MKLLPQAVEERWTVARYAKEADVSTNTAMRLLQMASNKLANKADRELGVLAGKMQAAAHTAVPATVELCERTLSACSRVVERLEADIQEFQTIPGKHGDTPASIVLAGAAQKLASAMSTLGATIKDLTGLKAAEAVAVNTAKEKGRKDDSVDPWAVDFQVVDV